MLLGKIPRVKLIQLPTPLEEAGRLSGRGRDALVQRSAAIAGGAAALLESPVQVLPEEIIVYDQYVGPDYGVPTPLGIETIRLAARTEGLILDPVYTGKAMAGMIDLIRRGDIGRDETVVFWHTGGGPGLFAHVGVFESSS